MFFWVEKVKVGFLSLHGGEPHPCPRNALSLDLSVAFYYSGFPVGNPIVFIKIGYFQQNMSIYGHRTVFYSTDATIPLVAETSPGE